MGSRAQAFTLKGYRESGNCLLSWLTAYPFMPEASTEWGAD
jgi:hypothetical protein